jgi:hypothetical protein
MQALPSSHRLASSLGVTPHNLQLQKASFFGDEDDDMELTVAVGGFLSPAMPPQNSSVAPNHIPSFGTRHWSPSVQPKKAIIPTLDATKLFSPKRPAFEKSMVLMGDELFLMILLLCNRYYHKDAQ